MKSSFKKANVTKRPLFRKVVASASGSTDQAKRVTASYIDGEKERTKTVVVVEPEGEPSQKRPRTIDRECKKQDGALSVQGKHSLNQVNEDSSDSDKQTSTQSTIINVRRRRSSKRLRRASVNDSSSNVVSKNVLDELMWESGTEQQSNMCKFQNGNLRGNVAKHPSNHDDDSSSVLVNCPAVHMTSTPMGKVACEADSSEKGHAVDSGGDLLLDYFGVNGDDDDSKLAALDVSELILSHGSVNHDTNTGNVANTHSKDILSEVNTASQDIFSELNTASEDILSGTNIASELDILSDLNTVSDDMLMGVDAIEWSKNEANVSQSLFTSCNEKCDGAVDGNEQFYGLPPKVGDLIKKFKGIEKLYDWQNDCLNLPGLKQRKNLIYSLPTSGGKTLVAEILIMKELLCHEKDAILILPFVSIVQEKVRDLSLFAVDLEFLVEEYASSKGKFPPRKRKKKKSLYVATIEKANGLVNSLVEENRLSEIGLVVVDELHMLGEGGHRGATLEMCLSKILFCSKYTQIMGMSATLSNIEDLQSFLNADKYVNDFRPVELKEFLKVEEDVLEVLKDKIGKNEEIPFKCSRRVRHQTSDQDILRSDPDHLSRLVQEVIPKYSCLVFCATKKNCENVAELLAKCLPKDLKKVNVKEKHELLRALKSNTDGVCPVLRHVIPYGLAYHHSGLTMDERKLIEDAYSNGTLCLLTCTSTLAAGVNLPAKRVILRSPYVGMNFISRSQYKQMIGRAGRAGIDTSGESILIFNKRDREKVKDLVNAPLESCRSSLLHDGGSGLRSLVLSLIGLKVCNSLEEISEFVSKTLLAVQNDSEGNTTLLEKIMENVEALVNLKLVQKSTVDGMNVIKVEATALGRASFKGCVDVDRSPFIYEEIKRSQENLVLSNDLHLLYLVTTPTMIENIRPSWNTYLRQISGLNAVEQKAAEFVGVSEAFLSRKIAGCGSRKSETEMVVVKRFYLTLILYKVVQERSLWEISDTFDIPRGLVQSLFSSSCSFASNLVHFTTELPEFHNIKLLLETIVDKLSYTAIIELVPLMQIPGVKKNRAKQLYKAGYRNLQSVAKCDPNTLVQGIEHLSAAQARLLVSSAKMLLLEKAEALQEEAADLIAN